MYKYQYCITTAKKIDNISDYSTEIEKCVFEFNKASHKARNYKNIVLPITYDKGNIEFTFESKHDLGDSPSLKPLWLFSKLLLEVDGLKNYCVNKRFLKIVYIKRKGIDDLESELSDKEILKVLLDIYIKESALSPYMNRLNTEVKLEINHIVKKYLDKRE